MGSTGVRTRTLVTETDDVARPATDEVKDQLTRLLASPLFNHSKHYPSLLKYVVNETLEGHQSHLKERALGVEVFGRSSDYDTNADPVVRTSACEVRKRIAQYYHEPGHAHEIRIDLPSGSYVPEFRYPVASPLPLTLVEPPVEPALVEPLPEAVPAKRLWMPVAIAASAIVALGIAGAVWATRPSAIEKFWRPVWGTEESVMLAMGSPPWSNSTPPAPVGDEGPTYRDVMKADNLAFADALTMARINGVAREYGKKKLDVRRASAYTLTDLRKGSLVLVGAFNNPWSMRLVKDLRFYYEPHRDTHIGYIVDRQNPGNRAWMHDPGVPYAEITQDFALVTRFVDPLTERMVVVVGGMGRDGTIAAGEFVTDPRYLDMLAKIAPRNWEKKNVQVVLATDIVKGNTGPPRILATYFW